MEHSYELLPIYLFCMYTSIEFRFLIKLHSKQFTVAFDSRLLHILAIVLMCFFLQSLQHLSVCSR